MTEDNTPDPDTSAGSGASEPAAAPPPSPAKSRGGRALGVTALILAVGAIAVSGYLWYQVHVEQRLSQSQLLVDIKDTVNSSRVEVTALEKELEAVQSRQQDLAERVDEDLAARLDSLESGQDALTERNETLAGSIEQIYEELDRSLDSWALEEVEQLLRIANHSLRLSGDIDTATAGLELADKRLEEIGNPAFLPVREHLADNITALKNIEPVDVAGLSLRLSRMAARVEDLPLAQKTERPISGSPDAEAEDESDRWLDAGGELLSDLKQLVRIQNIEEPPKPLLAPEQRYFLFSNLRLMLSGAQIAALRQDTGTYRENLERAAQWLTEYFDTSHQGVSQLLSDIDEMRGNELNPELPDVSDSLVALRQAKTRMQAQ